MALKTERLNIPGYEQVVYGEDPTTGLRAIISVHQTKLGPACGGVRLLPYKDRDEALEDVLRLSKGMSYKSSLAGIDFGGGKSVIIANPKDKTPELFKSMGEFVESLGGKYISAKDMNVTSEDLLVIKSVTSHVIGIDGQAGSGGDPSPVTARGVFRGIEASLEEKFGSKGMKGRTFAVQGLGAVGFDLCTMIHSSGGTLVVTDVDPVNLKKTVEATGASEVAPDSIYDVDCDVFVPCARGAILNPDTIGRLKCTVVSGAANNQLLTDDIGYKLHESKVLYAPDYLVNAGGIINVFVELGGYDKDRALKLADGIYDTLKKVYQRSAQEGAPPFIVANKLAEERINA